MPSNPDPCGPGPLDDLDALPLVSPAGLADFGPTLVVAPHPDDESLGCGGLITLLRQAMNPVNVVVVSDGTGSHPDSREYPTAALRDLRESESIAAVSAMGLSAEKVSFLRLPDTRVPHPGDQDFSEAVATFARELVSTMPATIVLPWRRDPHADHRGTWHIATQACEVARIHPRLIEYPIWVWDLGTPQDMPRAREMHGWRLDISTVLERKIAAITAHRSQTTALIRDDPSGFRLQPEILERFTRPWEIYLEPCHD